MNEKLLQPDVQEFINANLSTDLHSLLLKKSPFPGVSIQEIAQQIKGKKVAQKKFPFLLRDGILFPPGLNLEQASSETTGLYKSLLAKGKSMADLTAGFGVDAYFLSKNFEKITLIEQNPELLEIVKHNWKILGKNAAFINAKLEDFLIKNKKKFDLIYLDPARRDEHKNKVFLLEDLSPNILEIKSELFKISDKVLIKLSPLIDIFYLENILENLSEIHIVSVKNDVKELLILLGSKNQNSSLKVFCADLGAENEVFEFNLNEIKTAKAEYSQPEKYIYIPNNAILKSGAFNLVAEKFNLKKLHPNTQLYTSKDLNKNFPGRILEIEQITAKEIPKGEQFNIISKNHPLTPEQIRKKYRLRDGGNRYLIFTEDISGKIILKSL